MFCSVFSTVVTVFHADLAVHFAGISVAHFGPLFAQLLELCADRLRAWKGDSGNTDSQL
jgi:hypothetical protein